MDGIRARSTASPTASEPATSADPIRALRERATALALERRFVESEVLVRQALRARPDDADAMNELGFIVWHQGRRAEAVAILQHALRVAPDNPRVYTNLGRAYLAVGKTDEAADYFRAAVRIDPRAFDALINLGLLLSNRGDFDEAMEPLLAAFAISPDSDEAVLGLGVNLARLGRWAEAICYYKRALRDRPDHPELHRSLGYARLVLGDFERGWPEHEWRRKCQRHVGCRVNRPLWDGSDFPDRTILLHFEQGFGDTIQFIRYATLVKSRGGRVAVLCRQPLAALLSRCEGVDLAFDGAGGFEPECHLQAPLMSLPMILGTTLETIPARVPYLVADPAQVEHWRTVLDHVRDPGYRTDPIGGGESDREAAERPFLVGIAWQGEPTQGSDRWRSFPLAQFAPLAALPGVRLISLQVGPGTEQLAALGGRFPVIELPGRLGSDFDETAAIASQLDLVIAPDTAVAHLAGGLGVPVWVPLGFACDWRWLAGREDSPWYPTLRLFRQTHVHDWEGAFDRMAGELRAILSRRRGNSGLLAA
jgi:tetratricopeptide (TPR) repeat protein